MKFLRYFPLILTTAALLSLGSCKQDLGQDPPFDYPDEGSSGVQLPDPLYHWPATTICSSTERSRAR